MLQGLRKRLHHAILAGAEQMGRCDMRDTIVITGAPRSGTTLLLEVLGSLPGYKALNEPLRDEATRLKHGFHIRTFIDHGAIEPERRRFLADILQGQAHGAGKWLLQAQTTTRRLTEQVRCDKLVVKFCRISRMLQWFAEQFPVRGIVFIVRHPCAVVDSMLRYGQWRTNPLGTMQNAESSLYIGHLPVGVQRVFAPILARISTHTEALATLWCLDHYMPLLHDRAHPWILVPYERLVGTSGAELERIGAELNIEGTTDLKRLLTKPSSSVKGGLEADPASQIAKWQRQLSPRQIDEILQVVDEAGLSEFWTEAPEPRYDRLDALQRHPAALSAPQFIRTSGSIEVGQGH
jgi:hypothetical protein